MFIARSGHIVLSTTQAYIIQPNIWKLDLTKKNPTLFKTYEQLRFLLSYSMLIFVFSTEIFENRIFIKNMYF